MKKYVCSVCGFIYDEAKGIPEAGIAPGTRWEQLPPDWVCPLCGASKAEFTEQGDAPPRVKKPVAALEQSGDMQELSALEMSALCSNLARGCEKQYKSAEAALFTELSDYFRAAGAPAKDPAAATLLHLIEQDLETGFPTANAASGDANDRGALRALVWSEKVTRILKSLLTRYEKEGDAMLQNTGVYVCTICGFIFVGDQPPALCPVCKVPSWKFEKMEGRAQ
ncbi:MAG: rubredoxin [Pygmaiobacter sp.]